MIKQKKFIKEKEVEQTISLKKTIMDQVDEYISLAGIEHGVVRAGEAKSTQEAKREYFIIECIKEILERDKTDLAALKDKQDLIVEDEVKDSPVIKSILGDEISDIVSSLTE